MLYHMTVQSTNQLSPLPSGHFCSGDPHASSYCVNVLMNSLPEVLVLQPQIYFHFYFVIPLSKKETIVVSMWVGG